MATMTHQHPSLQVMVRGRRTIRKSWMAGLHLNDDVVHTSHRFGQSVLLVQRLAHDLQQGGPTIRLIEPQIVRRWSIWCAPTPVEKTRCQHDFQPRPRSGAEPREV